MIAYEDILEAIIGTKRRAKKHGADPLRRVVMNTKIYEILKKGFEDSLKQKIEDIQSILGVEIVVNDLAPDDTIYLMPLEEEKEKEHE